MDNKRKEEREADETVEESEAAPTNAGKAKDENTRRQLTKSMTTYLRSSNTEQTTEPTTSWGQEYARPDSTTGGWEDITQREKPLNLYLIKGLLHLLQRKLDNNSS